MNVLIDLGIIYLVVAGFLWVMSFTAWLMDASEYRRGAGDLVKLRWWFRNVYSLGLLWLPLIIGAIFRAARISITGERVW